MLVIVLLVSLLNFFIVGQLHVFDLIRVEVEDGFNATSVQIIGGSTMGVHLFAQALSLAAVTMFPERKHVVIVMQAGLIIWAIGVFTSTFAKTIYEFGGVYISLVGLGGGVVIWSGFHLVMGIEHSEYISLPTYVVVLAGGLGDVTYAYLLPSSDWKYTLRILSMLGLGLGTAALSAAYTLPAQEYLPLEETRATVPRLAYWCLVLSVGITSFAIFAPMEVLPMGEFASAISALYAIGTLVGKAAPLVVLKFYTGALVPLACSYVFGVVVLFWWVMVEGDNGTLAYAFFAGMTYGACSSFLLGFLHKLRRGVGMLPYMIIQVPGAITSGLIYHAIASSCGSFCAKSAVIGAFGGTGALLMLFGLYQAQLVRKAVKNG